MFLSRIKKLFFSNKEKETSFLSGQTISSIQDKKLFQWDNEDIISELEFKATLQLRTPLEILRHHNEIFSKKNAAAPNYAKEIWQGLWLPKTKSFKEMGFNIEEIDITEQTSSDIGYVKDKEYLPFLIKFREIIETDFTINKKIKQLIDLSKRDENFKLFFNKHKEFDSNFPDSFFYMQLTDIKGIGAKTAKSLYESGFKTIEELKRASKDDLLSIKGLGKSTLIKIQAYIL